MDDFMWADDVLFDWAEACFPDGPPPPPTTPIEIARQRWGSAELHTCPNT